MTYDSTIPAQLKKTQQWFGSIISRPIDEDSRMNPISPSGLPMEEEAFKFIAPSPTLRPAQRIQIYNQQYWWRLLTCLHEAYPLVMRLFGYHDFNQSIAIPYLIKYPPNDWSLNTLGARLPKWLEEEYQANDKNLVLDAAWIDWAFNDSFCCAKLIIAASPSDFSDKRIYLQPYLHLFQMPYDMFKFRVEVIKEKPEHWGDNEFPELPKMKNTCFAVWRNHQNDISWDIIDQAAYLLLQQLKKGLTIDGLCEWLETQDPTICEKASTHLHLWFQEWTARHWLTLEAH